MIRHVIARSIEGGRLLQGSRCPKWAVVALAIDKVGPRLYHFRSGPTTQPGSKKVKSPWSIVLLS